MHYEDKRIYTLSKYLCPHILTQNDNLIVCILELAKILQRMTVYTYIYMETKGQPLCDTHPCKHLLCPSFIQLWSETSQVLTVSIVK